MNFVLMINPSTIATTVTPATKQGCSQRGQGHRYGHSSRRNERFLGTTLEEYGNPNRQPNGQGDGGPWWMWMQLTNGHSYDEQNDQKVFRETLLDIKYKVMDFHR